MLTVKFSKNIDADINNIVVLIDNERTLSGKLLEIDNQCGNMISSFIKNADNLTYQHNTATKYLEN